MSDADQNDDGRRRHYSQFYGLGELPADGYGVVAGNCQAESLRIVLDGGGARWVRIPAIHELVATDIPYLQRLLGQASVLVSQPIRDNYHGLPIGTRNLVEALRPGTPTVIMPVIRFAGLYPTHVLIRPPADPGLTPPTVAYHDLRTLAEAADRLNGQSTPLRPVSPEFIRSVGERSLGELRSREQRHGAIVVSDLFERPSFDQMRTINHPGNTVWLALAARVNAELGEPPTAADPGREILNNVHAPRSGAVVEAYGLDSLPESEWIVDGIRIADADVRDAHLRWYAQNPDVVEAGILRHLPTLKTMGYSR